MKPCNNCGSIGGNIGCDTCGPPAREKQDAPAGRLTDVETELLKMADTLSRAGFTSAAIVLRLAADIVARSGKQGVELRDAIAALEAIGERYIDGSDTYEDRKFMGEKALAFLSEDKTPDSGAKGREIIRSIIDRRNKPPMHGATEESNG